MHEAWHELLFDSRPVFTGTYRQCVVQLCLRRDEGADLARYDIRNTDTGRLVSWVLR